MRTLLILFLFGVPFASAMTLDDFLQGSLADTKEIVFSTRSVGQDGHWYANFGYWSERPGKMMYGKGGGGLKKLNLKTGKVTTILDAGNGSVRDPYVHYDGQKILFSYRKNGSIYYNIYEINIDGTGLKQITDGPFDDIEPAYLPDGGIVFCSSRCNRWVNCWFTQVAVLYRCSADGSNIQMLSSNIEHDNTPWPLPDGRILYTRWEYVDRYRGGYHHLWTTNPDGTGQMVYYGNQHSGVVMIDAKPIPGSDKVVCSFSPLHGEKEHGGTIAIVSPANGPDDVVSVENITENLAFDIYWRRIPTHVARANKVPEKNFFRDPYPISEDCFLFVQEKCLYVSNAKGEMALLYKLDEGDKDFWMHEPRPIASLPRERLIPSRTDMKSQTGTLILSDVNRGRNMDGIKRGDIKKLLIMETLPKPTNHSGLWEPISLGGTFTLPRILGTVPVEEDGSAYMELPALRSLFFVALDENDMSVKRMQSFTMVMPGETTSCVGCHEHRTNTAQNSGMSTVTALKRPPSKIEPIPGVPDVFDFPRDIKPVLDRHCVKCHDYDRSKGNVADRPKKNVILTGDRSRIYSHAYVTLMSRPGLVSHGKDAGGNIAPRKIGSSASGLMEKINGEHHNVKLSKQEQALIRLWIESGAPYAGTYAALGTGMVQAPVHHDAWQKRCVSCHEEPKYYVRTELYYNLTRPEKSLALLAPLAKSAGGYNLCKQKDNQPVFEDTSDLDYQLMLETIGNAKSQLEKIKRFDMDGFKPGLHYIREMKRYGILPKDHPADKEIDVYTTDRSYWKSLWYKPSTD